MTAPDQPMAEVVRLVTGGKRGTLTAPAGGPLPVRVYDRDPDVLTLVLIDADTERLDDGPLSLEYVSARGLVRFQGRAVLERRDLVSFAVASPPEVVQRRDFVRVETEQPVCLTGDRPHDTTAIDLSGGGMLLSGPTTLEVGTAIRFSLRLDPGEPPVEGGARVVRGTAGGGRALVFEQIAEADRQRLIHFVFARHRAALAKGSSR